MMMSRFVLQKNNIYFIIMKCLAREIVSKIVNIATSVKGHLNPGLFNPKLQAPTFQPPDFSTMNFPTPDFSTINF